MRQSILARHYITVFRGYADFISGSESGRIHAALYSDTGLLSEGIVRRVVLLSALAGGALFLVFALLTWPAAASPLSAGPGQQDFSLTKTVNDPFPGEGELLTYTLVVDNVGDEYLSIAVISDSIPSALDYVPGSVTLDPPGAGNIGSPPILANDVQIMVGMRVTVTYQVIPGELAGGEVITNVAEAFNAQLQRTAATSITVAEINQPPTFLDIPAAWETDENVMLTIPISATDADVPPNTLTYAIEEGPAGAYVNQETPTFIWTPTEAQGPGVYAVTLSVIDDGEPPLTDTEEFVILVNEVNQAPVFPEVADQTIPEGAPWALTVGATDADWPPNTLTYNLEPGAPDGLEIDPATGDLSWTPTEAQGPGTYPVTLIVIDDGNPPLSDTVTFSIAVTEINQVPVLPPVADQAISEGEPWALTGLGATDADVPTNTLTYALEAGAPVALTIDEDSGDLSWTPTEAQGPGTYPVTLIVIDDGDPPLSDTVTFNIVVTEVNQAPVLLPVADQAISEGAPWVLAGLGATDADVPSNTLTYALEAGAPVGLTIDEDSGDLSWTPTEAQGPGDYAVTIRVTDDGQPTLSHTQMLTITVSEVNEAPEMAAINDLSVDEGASLAFTATATDADVPANTLTYTLGAGAPDGAQINPTTGGFTWIAPLVTEAVAYPVTIRVSDGQLEDAETFEITVIDTEQRVYLPMMVNPALPPPPPEWELVEDDFEGIVETWSVASCGSGVSEVSYIGTDDGLYQWQATDSTWARVGGPVGEVRGIAFAETDCDVVYATSVDNGVWKRAVNGSWSRVDVNLSYARAVVVRGGQVFASGGFGVRYANVTDGPHNWQATGIVALTTNLNLQPDTGRIYAAVGGVGVAYNDAAESGNHWVTIPAPTGDSAVQDVWGLATNPDEVLLGTTSRLYYWDGSAWTQVLSQATYTLAQGQPALFAGQAGGVQQSADGVNWTPLGQLSHTVRDLFIFDGYLYAATTEGLWRWSLTN